MTSKFDIVNVFGENNFELWRIKMELYLQ